jgi:hypothetical protein
MENGAFYIHVCVQGSQLHNYFCVNNILSFILKVKNLAVIMIFAFPNFSKFINNQNKLLNQIGVKI